MRIVLVQCTNSKHDGARPAVELYGKSQYFRKQQAYAEVAADSWYIQSAKYGLVAPHEEIESYNTRARDLDDRGQWAKEIAKGLSDRVCQPSTIEVLGGKRYANPLTPELESRGFDVIEPLRGLRIGERMQKLNHKIEEQRHALVHG